LWSGEIVAVTGPRDHFPLDENASKSLLFGGGIGITPMAHRLYAIGKDFELHYSFHSRTAVGFIEHLEAQPWSDRVHIHCSEEGTLADLEQIVGAAQSGHVLYTYGPEAFMEGVIDAGEAGAGAEEDMHMEYFSTPEEPEYENAPLSSKGRGRSRWGRSLSRHAE
jgi:ferredoxin-NADP reductase